MKTPSFRIVILSVMLVALCVLGCGQAMAQSITNGDFAEWAGDKPKGWTPRDNKQKITQATDTGHASVKTALQVEVVKDAGSSYGQILQSLKLDGHTRYKISCDIRSTGNGTGVIQVKTISNKTELERLETDRSGTKWKTVSVEFDTAGADEAQLLCRYRQNDGAVGQKIWWTNMKVEKIGDGKEARDPLSLEIAKPGSDQYVTPDGAGDKNGVDWANARSAADGLQKALEAVGPGNTLHIGSGEYVKAQLEISAGGSGPEAMVNIVGQDTGKGLPRFTSDFDKNNPAKTGGDFLKINPYVGFVAVKDLKLEGYRVGILLLGPNRGLRITNMDMTGQREGIIINGGAFAKMPDSGSGDLVIRDCDFTHYTKRGIRIRGGVHHTQIINCHADAGGKEWATEPFHMGFALEGSDLEGVTDHDITFDGCTARNNYHENGDNYWNADGFCAERQVKDITFKNCGAFGNTDGGWDLKAMNPVLENCVSFDNKRNFRMWSKPDAPARFNNCIAGYANHRGGSGNPNGVHVSPGGAVVIDHMTFVNTATGVDLDGKPGGGSQATVTNSLFYIPKGKAFSTEEGCKITIEDSVVIDADHPEGDPGIKDASPKWEGGDDKFNSLTHPDKGYKFPGATDTPGTQARQ